MLKKQIVKVKENVNGGAYVLVSGGLSMDDKIAFPYSKSIKEGNEDKGRISWIRLWDMIPHHMAVLVKEGFHV